MASDPTLSIVEFHARLPARGALLGLDLGSKTIGLAIADATRTVASALTTIRRRKFRQDAEELLGIASANAVCGLVIGLPLDMSGAEGPRVQSTRAFTRNLAPMTDLPMTLWDERLSTVAAERALIEADASRRRRAEVIDKLAATVILQGALERMRGLAAMTPPSPAEDKSQGE